VDAMCGCFDLVPFSSGGNMYLVFQFCIQLERI
jgi:hypothetical protein